MAVKYLKKSPKTSSTDDSKTREIVENILKDIEKTKEEGCKELGKNDDLFHGSLCRRCCSRRQSSSSNYK